RFANALFPRQRFKNFLVVSTAQALLLTLYIERLPARTRAPTRPHDKLPRDDAPNPEIQALFAKIARASLPQTFTSKFSQFENAAREKKYRRNSVSVKGGVLMFNENEIFEAAFAEQSGERIASVQHGGAYGVSLSQPDTAETEYRQDSMVTWGWKRHTEHELHAVPLPSPFLSKIRDRHRQKTNDIILVGTQQRAYGTRLDSSPRGYQVIEYRQDKLRFITGLSPDARNSFAYRPGAPDVSAYDDAPFIEREVGPVRLITEDFHKAILRCKLMIIDHLGTTTAISLAANAPTVTYLREEFWPISQDSSPYFAKLAEVGIFHSDPVSAAKHVNAVIPNVADWWFRDDVQAVREEWLSMFARTSNNWRQDWRQAMAEI
ncbi:MAG: LIC12162 family protein, partial [Pseudomonadota bacterium]|nr:LIC12162 family protein [Pseudomonadota bacterium]